MLPTGQESRNAHRRRTRLRPVKLVTASGRFIQDGTALDGSANGARILRYEAIPLPARIAVFDESDRTLRAASIVWTQAMEMGVRFAGPARAASPAEIARLTGRYYALPD
ncbi:PilZ domain-containing protein [Aurantimonas aggregata]|uniref:PilZ domain-containing protein n=1 Tax=Aurantimonas aggregata TaxID=2047720 RepID=A0A6L9MDC9_9HYPH|nr:PilZ domain-containing protein [Aurantimonas aggregata]NDV85720.1 PilZ domain-containing protein [Aurantimonas aggregata]